MFIITIRFDKIFEKIQLIFVLMSSARSRCAACKYLRRKCPSNCIFSPYFPSDDPQRFSCVHRIYGASNIGKMLQQLPVHLRAEAANSLYFEAHSRREDPVYGCVGIITNLHEEIHDAEIELAKIQAHIGFHRHSNNLEDNKASQSGHGPPQQQ